ncbi:hypothetical protein B0H13DRAFT_2344699 [Mycena leptocephala]|nr:hypothetical protein B0H13DRAFT_2344699 [Mycena leptocephala]
MENDLSPSSHSRLRGRPSSYLHKACENCRRRKIRCDSQRPVCTQCRLRPPRTLEPCRFSHTPLGDIAGLYNGTGDIDIVEETQLGIPDIRTAGGEVFLSDPYSMKHAFPNNGLGRSMLPNVRVIQSVMEEPLQAALEILVDAFLSRFYDGGFFFLESLRFRESRCSPIHLAIQTARPPDFSAWCISGEATYLPNAGNKSTTTQKKISLVSRCTTWPKICPCIWTHEAPPTVLPAYGPGRTSLAAALDTPGSVEPPSFLSFMEPNPRMLTPTDAVEVNQRVNALWAVLVLDKLWAVASGSHQACFDASAWDQANPILGPLLYVVCNFYISHSHLCAAPKVTENLQILLSVMSSLAELSPMIQHCCAATQEYYSSMADAKLQCH